MKTLSFFIIFCTTFLVSNYALGQNLDKTSHEGLLHILNWPHSAYGEARTDSLINVSEILPLIDSLTFGYEFSAGEEQPSFSYTIEWRPKGSVFFDGEERNFDELPGDVLIESLVLQSEVIVEDKPAAKLTIVNDSLMSEAFPGLVSVELVDLTWTTLFDDTDAATAQSFFSQGFELTNPQILEITFVYFEDELVAVENSDKTKSRRPRQPTRRTIYRPGISIWVNTPVYPRRPPPRVVRNPPRTETPRGDQVGRGKSVDEEERRNTDRRNPTRAKEEDEKTDESTRNTVSGRKKKKSDDEEEDEGDLMPAAVIGAAAVVAAAFIGGTIGYYGNTKNTPIGLMTGYVQQRGGILLQLAVNKAVVERSKVETELFTGRIAGFYDLFNSPIQPAIGLGAMVSQRDNEVDYELSISPGLAGNFGPLVLLGGYDVVSGGMDIGLAYNFRAKRK